MASLIIVLALLIPLVLLIRLLIKMIRSDGKQQTDRVTLRTTETAQEAADRIRRMAAELNADIDRVNEDPLGGPVPEIAVVLSGLNHDLDGTMWAVQIYVRETGNGCEVDLAAMGLIATRRSTGRAIKLASSIKQRDRIAAKLRA